MFAQRRRCNDVFGRWLVRISAVTAAVMFFGLQWSSGLVPRFCYYPFHIRSNSSFLCPPTLYSLKSQSQSYDRRSVGQSIFELSTHLGLTARFLLLSDICGFVHMGRSLWREDGSVVYFCCWPSPAQSFSGPSSVGLITIFYSLRFETSLFVASYDSQGYGGGIRNPLHTGHSQSQSHIATDGQSVCLSWCRAPSGAHDQILVIPPLKKSHCYWRSVNQ
jgi:hypothetical protein